LVLASVQNRTLASLLKTTRGLISNSRKSFKDALLDNNSAPLNVDTRILAREGIKAQQILFDLPANSETRELNQGEILKRFNKALTDAGGDAAGLKFQSVERLVNKGILGEFAMDEGAKWIAQQVNADNFIAALSPPGDGLTVKKRNHLVITYYIPLHLNTGDPSSITEIEEVNGILEGELLQACWVKPPNQRSTKQTCRHLILTFSNPDTANRAKGGGLVIVTKEFQF